MKTLHGYGLREFVLLLMIAFGMPLLVIYFPVRLGPQVAGLWLMVMMLGTLLVYAVVFWPRGLDISKELLVVKKGVRNIKIRSEEITKVLFLDTVKNNGMVTVIVKQKDGRVIKCRVSPEGIEPNLRSYLEDLWPDITIDWGL
mgnify:CR=1 FL=1